MQKFAAVLFLLLAVAATPSRAGEIVIGLGADDVSRRSAAPSFSLELRASPFREWRYANLGLGWAAIADTDGDVWTGVGLVLIAPLGDLWRLEGSFMPGVHIRGSGNDLGTSFPLFRSQIGASRTIGPDWRAGFALSHQSNADTALSNPGVETFVLTFTRGF